MRYIVRLDDQGICYGPFEDEDVAAGFAACLTREVDPATVIRLRDPMIEMLAVYGQFMVRDGAA